MHLPCGTVGPWWPRCAPGHVGRPSTSSRADGGPFQGWGQGRVWPLLTGERAHYELAARQNSAAGLNVDELIHTYEKFATGGQLLPEQVWDEADRPECSLRLGQPAGSAVPLVWAHAEYLKLLRSAVDGKVFDRIDPAYERYCAPEGRKRRSLEIYSRRRPIQRMDAGGTLRILDENRFEAVWSDDGWKTVNSALGRALGSVGFSADISPALGCGAVEWTLHWLDAAAGQDAWLGYNMKVKMDAL